jgi:hypothetical protein
MAQLIRERFPTTNLTAWLEGNPHQYPGIFRGWRASLLLAGVLEAA